MSTAASRCNFWVSSVDIFFCSNWKVLSARLSFVSMSLVRCETSRNSSPRSSAERRRMREFSSTRSSASISLSSFTSCEDVTASFGFALVELLLSLSEGTLKGIWVWGTVAAAILFSAVSMVLAVALATSSVMRSTSASARQRSRRSLSRSLEIRDTSTCMASNCDFIKASSSPVAGPAMLFLSMARSRSWASDRACTPARAPAMVVGKRLIWASALANLVCRAMTSSFETEGGGGCASLAADSAATRDSRCCNLPLKAASSVERCTFSSLINFLMRSTWLNWSSSIEVCNFALSERWSFFKSETNAQTPSTRSLVDIISLFSVSKLESLFLPSRVVDRTMAFKLSISPINSVLTADASPPELAMTSWRVLPKSATDLMVCSCIVWTWEAPSSTLRSENMVFKRASCAAYFLFISSINCWTWPS
mmetsp:Transcript_39251/g.83606  ORF Transcript_39251/g.83606 Transcript_39251/m.83606 type:complete len:424 (-) Transcript_39251:590-1861(-)